MGDETLKLRFSTNAMVTFEEVYGQNFTVVESFAKAVDVGSVSFKCLRALIFAGVSDSDPISLTRAGDIIDEVGAGVAMRVVMEAVRSAFPDPDGEEGNGEEGNGEEVTSQPD